jgi:hypothetical protein
MSLSAPQTGHTQSSGSASKAVPGAAQGWSPSSGSYMYEQTPH